MNLEDFKKEFDEKLAAMSDKELIDAFAEMGCEVEINPERLDIGTIAIPVDMFDEYARYSNDTDDNRLPFGVYRWYITCFYKEMPYHKSKRYRSWLKTCPKEEATHVKLHGGCGIIREIKEIVYIGGEYVYPANETWNANEIQSCKDFYQYKLNKAEQETPENSSCIEYERRKLS